MGDLGAMSQRHERILKLREELESQKLVCSKIQAALDEEEGLMMDDMKAANLTSFRSAAGQVVLTKRFTVKLPQSPEDWRAFWAYLDSIGHAEALKTVNHQRLNGWYKAELDAARERNDFDWAPPGLQPPTTMDVLQLRR